MSYNCNVQGVSRGGTTHRRPSATQAVGTPADTHDSCILSREYSPTSLRNHRHQASRMPGAATQPQGLGFGDFEGQQQRPVAHQEAARNVRAPGWKPLANSKSGHCGCMRSTATPAQLAAFSGCLAAGPPARSGSVCAPLARKRSLLKPIMSGWSTCEGHICQAAHAVRLTEGARSVINCAWGCGRRPCHLEECRASQGQTPRPGVQPSAEHHHLQQPAQSCPSC